MKIPKNLHKLTPMQAYMLGMQDGKCSREIDELSKGIKIGRDVSFIALYNVVDNSVKTEKTQHKLLQDMDKEVIRIMVEEIAPDYTNLEILEGRIDEIKTEVGVKHAEH